MASDRTNLLCILKVLEEYSDEDHILSLPEIQEILRREYGKELDRRTLYAAFDALADSGYDISRHSDNGKGYYLAERTFSNAEIRLMIDAIYSCEYISKKQTEELLEKLRGFLSVHERRRYSYSNLILPEKKSLNQQVFLNIEILDQAIEKKKKISFVYLDYDYDKKLKPRREELYKASPYSMICESEHYYLVMIAEGHSDPSFYRIDMMKDIKILDETIDISKRDAKLDSTKKVVYAHAGEPVQIHLHCQRAALRYVIERFGNDVIIKKNEDGSFEAFFRAAHEGMKYWALQYLQSVELISPEDLREEIVKAVRSNNYTKE